MPKHAGLHPILKKYELFKKQFKQCALSKDTTDSLQDLYVEAHSYLSPLTIKALKSDNPNKEYFAFQRNGGQKLSRAINKNLYIDDLTLILNFFDGLRNHQITVRQNAEEITKACYTIAITVCGSIDILKDSDQKTPGTFFEYFIGHLFAIQFKIAPKKQVDVLNLDMRATLPTDFIFDLGDNCPKFHVPVKTSTRERVVQAWAHQRVLDGVYGTGRFLGLLSCLSETKLNLKTNVVTEICLPDQWRIYQLFISQFKRVYYLDMPQKYKELNNIFPRIYVKPLGEFFFEANSLSL